MKEQVGHVVVCGLQELGLRVLEELDRLGEPVVVLARQPEPRYVSVATQLGATIVEGDPADPAALRACGIPGARAVVFTADGDVANIHGALAAVALDPGIHVVLRAFDEEFGRSVETLIPGSVALSASSLAAPGFVSALVDAETDRRLDMLGRDLALRSADPDDPAVLAVLADETQRPVALFPGATPRPETDDPDDAAALLARRRLCIVDASGDPARTVVARRGSRVPRIRTPRPSIVRRIDRRFWVLATVIVVLILLAAAYFQARHQDIGVVDAIYQAFASILGNADPSSLTTQDLKFFAIGLAIVGAIVLAAFYGLVVDVLMKTRVSNILGPHVGDARDHVIIVGFGSLGYRVGVALRERGIGVVAADAQPDPRFAAAARQHDIALLASDARGPDMLRTLRVEHARALLAATDDDAANLAIALRARAMRPDLRVTVRLFDPDLAARLETAFGGFESRSIHALAAPAFAAAAVGRQVLATIPVGTARVLIVARVPIEEGAPADGSTVGVEESRASSVELGGCRVLAIIDGQSVRWKPASTERLKAGQEVLIVATRRGLAATVRRGRAGHHDEPHASAPPGRVPHLPSLARIGDAVRGLFARLTRQ
jgi:Trk K+ transport system NAD-binding subunit